MKKHIYNGLKVLLSISLIVFLIYKVNLQSLISTLDQTNIYHILPAIILAFVLFFIETINFKFLLNIVHKNISYFKIFRAHLLSWSVGLFIPGRIGQFSIIYLFTKKGLSLGQSTAIVVIDKIITFTTLSIISIIGFYTLLPSQSDATKATIFLIVMCTIGLFFIIHSKGRAVIKRYILRKTAVRFAGFSQTIKKIIFENYHIILLNFVLTIIKFLCNTLMIWFFFKSIGFNINLIYIFVIMGMGIIISYIPISMNGIGVKESAAVYLYKLVNVQGVAVVGAYLLNLAMNYIIALVSLTFLFKDFTPKELEVKK